MTKRQVKDMDVARQAAQHIRAAGFKAIVTLEWPSCADGNTAFATLKVLEWIPCGVDFLTNAIVECDGERWTAIDARAVYVEVTS